MARSAPRDQAKCAPIRCCPRWRTQSSTPSASGSTICRSRLKRFCAPSRLRAARDRRRDGKAARMPVRSNIVGIDSPEALEKALRAAYYLADDAIATASYLALALGKPLLLEG